MEAEDRERGLRKTAGRGRIKCRVESANHGKDSRSLAIGQVLCGEWVKIAVERQFPEVGWCF